MVLVVFALSACGKSENTTKQSDSSAADNSVQSSETDAAAGKDNSAETSDSTGNEESIQNTETSKEAESDDQDTGIALSDIKETPVTKSLDEVADYLVSKKAVTGEQTGTAAEMIGAVSGFKYLDSNVEVYEYETDSDVYKEIVKTNKVKVEGLDLGLTASAINGKYVLFCEKADNKDDIVAIFKGMK